MEEKIGYIYKITSPNNKIYIGQTVVPKHRKSNYKNNHFKGHIKLWNNCIAHNWNPADTFEIIEECFCGEKKIYLNEREIYWINFYDSFNNGLNCNEGGHGNIGYKHSKESKEKMSKAHLGVKHSEERNKQKSEYTKGRQHSEEAKIKMSERKIQNMNLETREKISKSKIGNKNGLGNKGNSKKILCLNNNIIYESIKKAAEQLNLISGCICSVCKGKTKQHKGYKFEYFEEENNNI